RAGHGIRPQARRARSRNIADQRSSAFWRRYQTLIDGGAASRRSRPRPGASQEPRNERQGRGQSVYCGLIPAALITLAHFAVSSAMSLPKSAGEPASTMPPMSQSRAMILGSARPAFVSLLRASTIAAGVSLGAAMPNHELAS